jgi:hypothetical protein
MCISADVCARSQKLLMMIAKTHTLDYWAGFSLYRKFKDMQVARTGARAGVFVRRRAH